jgi:small subunit ribosomal protein S6
VALRRTRTENSENAFFLGFQQNIAPCSGVIASGATTQKEDRVIYNEYETIYILSPELSDEEVGKLKERINGVITQDNGKIVYEDPWGKRKLAYEIKKQQKGFFVHLDFLAPATFIKELERNLRNFEPVLKYQTILLGKNVDVEKRMAEKETDAQTRIMARKPGVVNLSDLDSEERSRFGHGEDEYSDKKYQDQPEMADGDNLPEER